MPAGSCVHAITEKSQAQKGIISPGEGGGGGKVIWLSAATAGKA